MTKKDLTHICLTASATVRECIEMIDRNKQGIALIVDAEGKLAGTITDGDIRRFILAGHSLDETTASVMWASPMTAPIGTSRGEIRALMNNNHIRNIPVLDQEGRLHDLVHLSDLIDGTDDEQIAFIMAGGEGKRLRPITAKIPKPLIKVGNKPIIANIIDGFYCGV